MSVSGVLRVPLPALALAAVLGAGLVGCGSDDGDTRAGDQPTASGSSSATGKPTGSARPTRTAEPSETAPPGTPDCSQVWSDGATIPRFYQGCIDQTGYVKPDKLSCSSGQSIIRYDDRFYGVAGGTVHQVTAPLDKDRQYLAAAMRCRA